MFLPAKKILQDALKRGYAVGAFNTSNLETTQAIVNAAAVKKSPLIINISEPAIKYAGLLAIITLIKSIAEQGQAKNLPIAIQLDHGKDFGKFSLFIKAGFTSIMIDASRLPYVENASLTKKTAELAHKSGVSVQAELGAVPYADEESSFVSWGKIMTDPNLAKKFVEETKVDSLAVAIGNAHGFFKERSDLDFERLRKISKLAKVPLVLHGASDFPADRTKEAVEGGVASFHIDTSLRVAFTEGIKEFLAENPAVYDPRLILGYGRQKVQKEVENKMEIFGSAGKA